MIIGIDASRNRSGGAKAHLIGILSKSDPTQYGIKEVHVWTYKTLLDEIPDRPWIIKHNPPELEQSILKQLWWQRFHFPTEVKKSGCDIVLNTDAGKVSRLSPCVTMSRDMLSYELGEMERYGISKARLRLIILRWVQNSSLRNADGIIFLTHYAAEVIQNSCGKLSNIAFIPHGVGDNFKQVEQVKEWPTDKNVPIECLYVSNTAMYKHQWNVVRAVELLREKGFPLNLKLVGGGSGKAQKKLEDQLLKSDPRGEFVKQLDFVPQQELPQTISNANLFIFASSCENMPNTLLEVMSVGIPIACSNRGPMPEVLENGGVYFDPENPEEIAEAVRKLIMDPALRNSVSRRARELSYQYSWSRCGNETWDFLCETLSKLSK